MREKMETIPQKMLRAIEKLANNQSEYDGKSLPEIAGITQDEYAKVIHGESVCSKNERAFLDEIREFYKVDDDGDLIRDTSKFRREILFQSDFTKTNLSELMEEKG